MNTLELLPAAERIAHQMRAAWPKTPSPWLIPTEEQQAKIQVSRSLMAAEAKKVEDFTGEEPPF